MERRELYDPEDIEQLLMERAYDDLLEEERAFVLRHLSDRSEYERMRALLLRMDDERREAAVIDADPSVRTHVMEAFRAQQRPQWRVWLNSVGGAFLPREGQGYWRPALALGAVAAIGLWTVTSLRNPALENANAVAEVKQELPKTAPLEENDRSEATLPAVPASEDQASKAETAPPATVIAPNTPDMLDDADLATESRATDEAPTGGAAMADAVMFEPVTAAGAVAKSTNEEIAMDGASMDTSLTVTLDFSHVVNQREMLTNASTANTSPAIKSIEVAEAKSVLKKRKAAAMDDQAKESAVADAGPLLGLLRAAW